MTEEEIIERVARYSRFKHRGKLTVHDNTTELMSIDAGHVIELAADITWFAATRLSRASAWTGTPNTG